MGTRMHSKVVDFVFGLCGVSRTNRTQISLFYNNLAHPGNTNFYRLEHFSRIGRFIIMRDVFGASEQEGPGFRYLGSYFIAKPE